MERNNSSPFTPDSVGISSVNVAYCGNMACPAGHFWGGVRETFLLHCVYAGEGIYRVNGNEFHLKAGDAFLARSGDSIFYKADEENPWSYCWVGFYGSECASLLLLTDFADSPVIHTGYMDELKECMLNIHRVHGYSVTDSLMMTGALYAVFACLVKHASNQVNALSEKMTEVQDISRYISSKLSGGMSVDNLSVKSVAAHFNMSESTLYRAFMSCLGISPIRYLTKMRIARAGRLLLESRESVTTIAASVGYPNGQAFAKSFKKEMGVTPSEYMRQHQSKELVALAGTHGEKTIAAEAGQEEENAEEH